MPDIITVFQDYKTSLSGYEEHFENILSFKQVVGSQNCVLEANGDFRISKYVGCLIKGNTCLQILPKIYSNHINTSKLDEIKETLQFVLRLLTWSEFINVKDINESNFEFTDDGLVEIIIRLFINKFLYLHNRNVYREYIFEEDDQLFIRGKIAFKQSILNRIMKPGFLRVEYDEFSINNRINQIIKTTIQKMLFLTSNAENKKSLRLGLSYLEEVDVINLNTDLFKTLTFNRMNESYKPLINLSEMLFQNRFSALSYGSFNTLSFVVPLNILFEKFFFVILKSLYPDQAEYHDGEYLAQSADGKDQFLLKPDFLLKKKSEVKMILDTKYKNPFKEDGSYNIGSSSIYQICTYAMRYDCQSVCLVYPLFKGQSRTAMVEQFKIKQEKVKLKISIIQIDVTETDYNTIVEQVKESVEFISGE